MTCETCHEAAKRFISFRVSQESLTNDVSYHVTLRSHKHVYDAITLFSYYALLSSTIVIDAGVIGMLELCIWR